MKKNNNESKPIDFNQTDLLMNHVQFIFSKNKHGQNVKRYMLYNYFKDVGILCEVFVLGKWIGKFSIGPFIPNLYLPSWIKRKICKFINIIPLDYNDLLNQEAEYVNMVLGNIDLCILEANNPKSYDPQKSSKKTGGKSNKSKNNRGLRNNNKQRKTKKEA